MPYFPIKRKKVSKVCVPQATEVEGLDPVLPWDRSIRPVLGSVSQTRQDSGMSLWGLGSEVSFPSSTCGTGCPPGAAIPSTQSPRAGAFPSFITSLPPSLDVSLRSSNRGEGGWRWVWGQSVSGSPSTGWGRGGIWGNARPIPGLKGCERPLPSPRPTFPPGSGRCSY